MNQIIQDMDFLKFYSLFEKIIKIFHGMRFDKRANYRSKSHLGFDALLKRGEDV